MPNVQAILDARSLTLTVSGQTGRDDILAAIRQHYPAFTGRMILWDFRNADVSALAREDLEAIAATAKSILPFSSGQARKTAYVVADHTAYVKACKYLNAAFAVGMPAEYRVFVSLEEARSWLGQQDR